MVNVAWIDVTARDPQRLRSFYSAVIGCPVEVDERLDYGLLQGAQGPIGGIGSSKGPHPAGVVAYLSVEDLDDGIERALQAGASIAVGPWEIPGLGRMVVLLDPEGNRVGLMS